MGDSDRTIDLPGGLTIQGGLGKNTVEQAGGLVIGKGGLTIDGKVGLIDAFTRGGSIDVRGGDVAIFGGAFADRVAIDGTLRIAGGNLTIAGAPGIKIPLVGKDTVTVSGSWTPRAGT